MSLRRSSRRAAAEANEVLTAKTPVKKTTRKTKVLVENNVPEDSNNRRKSTRKSTLKPSKNDINEEVADLPNTQNKKTNENINPKIEKVKEIEPAAKSSVDTIIENSEAENSLADVEITKAEVKAVPAEFIAPKKITQNKENTVPTAKNTKTTRKSPENDPKTAKIVATVFVEPASMPSDKEKIFKPIANCNQSFDEKFEEDELEDIMNNISLIGNVSQTEPEVDSPVEQELNQSISALFSYRR